MSKAKTNTLTLVLASLGCFVALVLFYKHLRPEAEVGCTLLRTDCGRVIESAYGHLGPIPTSIFGLGMYLTVVALCLKRRKLLLEEQQAKLSAAASPLTEVSVEEKEQALSELGITSPTSELSGAPSPVVAINPALKRLDLVLWLIALSAFGISWLLQYLAVFVVFSLCPWCFSSACLVTAIFIVTSYDYWLRGHKLGGEQKLMAGTLAFIGVMGLMMLFPIISNQISIDIHNQPERPHVVNTPAALPPVQSKDMEITGNANSPIMIVEFADYQCPHCKEAAFMMDSYMKEHPDRFQLAFRNFPLPMHQWAKAAAVAAEAAGEQHKFWEMHDYLYKHQSEMEKKSFTAEAFRGYAQAIGLDMKRFDQDVQSDKIQQRIDNDQKLASALITMTPTFFIYNGNGHPWQVTGVADMKAALEDPTNQVWQPGHK